VESERFTRRRYEFINPILTFCELFPEKVEDFFCIAVEQATYAVCPFFKKVAQLKSQDIGIEAAARALDMPYADRWWCEQMGQFPLSNKTEAISRFIRHVLRKDVEIFICGHHASHAANSFFSSGFSSAIAVTLDGGGHDFVLADTQRNLIRAEEDIRSHGIFGGVYRCDGLDCVPLYQQRDFSFGFGWHRVTFDILGLPEGAEGTVMAMASLGDPTRYREALSERWIWLPGHPSPADAPGLEAFFGRVKSSIHGEQDRYDVAASLQALTETRIRQYLERFIARDETGNLCVAGGTFLNCQIAGKLRDWFPKLREIYMPPAPYDGGISIGAAQLVRHTHFRARSTMAAGGFAPFALGREYSRLEVAGACRSAQVPIKEATASEVLALLRSGEVIGLFSGSAESGRRALGHRSIIADPTVPGMKDRINAQIKHREWFRPFAPMVLAEHVSEWFDCDPDLKSPYMSIAVPVREAVRDRIPAVVHLDGTARVQTVHRELTPGLHALLTQWHAMTGIPLLLNTSFNDREPIVESPADALNTLRRTPLYGIYFADFEISALNGAMSSSAAPG
jgi:carbamoyltransferase